jgi:RNA polymerase sigma-70 factor (ECF subfamily)
VAAAKFSEESADAALAKLCQLYWYPIYAFVRRRGYSQEDAKDLTQEFFARVLGKNYLKDADPSRGRFRSFLLVAVQHFLANEWNRQRAHKRGGGLHTIALDAQTAESRYHMEPISQENPQKLYERQWALALLDQVMASLRQEYVLDGRLDDFEKLAPLLTGAAQQPYAHLAQQWNTSEGAVDLGSNLGTLC